MKYIYLAALLLLTHSGTLAQKIDAVANVRAAAVKMGNALINKDYAGFVKTTYPKAINEENGGLKKLAEEVEKQVEGLAQQGNKVVGFKPGQPSAMVDTAGELQCTIPQQMRMSMGSPKGLLVTQTTLIALSPDKGITWYFMDAAGRDIHAMRQVYPGISSKLVIPADAEPKFEPAK